MIKIYVVASGEWEDHHIDAIFTTRKSAETFINTRVTSKERCAYDLLDGYSAPHEESNYHIYEDIVDNPLDLRTGNIYHIVMDELGVVNEIVEDPRDYDGGRPEYTIKHDPFMGMRVIKIYCLAESKEDAIEYANGIRLAQIKSGKWKEDQFCRRS